MIDQTLTPGKQKIRIPYNIHDQDSESKQKNCIMPCHYNAVTLRGQNKKINDPEKDIEER